MMYNRDSSFVSSCFRQFILGNTSEEEKVSGRDQAGSMSSMFSSLPQITFIPGVIFNMFLFSR